MPRRIKGPIRKGLPAKIYYLAYPKFTSKYSIVKKMYGDPRGGVKVYQWMSKEEGVLFETADGERKGSKDIISLPKPLVEEISQLATQNGDKLTNLEKHCLLKFLDSTFFRWSVDRDVVALGETRIKTKFDAAQTLVDIAGVLCSLALFYKQQLSANDLLPFGLQTISTVDDFESWWDTLSEVSPEDLITAYCSQFRSKENANSSLVDRVKEGSPEEIVAASEEIFGKVKSWGDKGIGQSFFHVILLPDELLQKIVTFSRCGVLLENVLKYGVAPSGEILVYAIKKI